MPGLALAYRLPQHVAERWPVSKADRVDAPHVTLYYAKPTGPMEWQTTAEAIRRVVARTMPFQLHLTGGVHTLIPTASSDGRTPVVAAVQSTGAVRLHRALQARLGLPQAHAFIPHATLAYAAGAPAPGAYEVPDVALVVDEVEIWNGAEVEVLRVGTDWPDDLAQ